MPNIGDIATTEDVLTGSGISVYSSLENTGDVLLQITLNGEPICQVQMPKARIEEMARSILSGGLSVQ